MDFNIWLKSRLTAHGYPVGAIDGDLDEVTTDALTAFQAARALPKTGRADAATVAALRASASAVSPAIRAALPDRDTAPLTETFQPSRTIWPRQADCGTFFGPVGTSQVQIDIPFDMRLAWRPATVIRRMTLHAKVAASAQKALQHIALVYSETERRSLGIDRFGGSLNVRRMRGGSAFSMHAWGIAIDFDPERNGLHLGKPAARLSHADAVPFWVAWEAVGWLSLGRARDFDWMHVQAARL